MNNSNTIFSIDRAESKQEPMPFRKAMNHRYTAYLKTLAYDKPIAFLHKEVCDNGEIRENTDLSNYASLDKNQILRNGAENKNSVRCTALKADTMIQNSKEVKNNVWYGKMLEVLKKMKSQVRTMCYTPIRNFVVEKILNNNIFMKDNATTNFDGYAFFNIDDLKLPKKYFIEDNNLINESEASRYSKSNEIDLKKELLERHAKMIDSEFMVLNILYIIGFDEWKKIHLRCDTCLLLLGFIENWKKHYDFSRCYSIYVGDLKTSLCLVHRTDGCFKKLKRKSYEYPSKRVKIYTDEISVRRTPKRKASLPQTNPNIKNKKKNIESIMKNESNSKRQMLNDKFLIRDNFNKRVKTNNYSVEKKEEITKEFPMIDTDEFEYDNINTSKIYSPNDVIFDTESNNKQIKEIIPNLENSFKMEYNKIEPSNSLSSSIIVEENTELKDSEYKVFKDLSFFKKNFSDSHDTCDLCTNSFVKLKINKEILEKEKEKLYEHGIFKLSIDVKRIENTEDNDKYIGNYQARHENIDDKVIQTKNSPNKPLFSNNQEQNAESNTESESKHKTGKWTADEDKKLLDLVQEYSYENWAKIAKLIETRSGKQCRERWKNHLNPMVTKKPISEEEASIIFEAQSRIGNKWCKISELLPGRSENTVKNFYFSYQRKHKKQHR
ncbi:Myb-like transcription factor [Hamiltosporidium tvaerminnensis]|uniref:Myb-like transcription factor n=1 Tax=Hamiltosporidium tvaerminnensis TaxID=1176355 RepID=A0A4Q9LC28_9MICR|nr:Myb-like transcription factor [Hamiltosporidium tvaerminnensis]